MEKKRNMLEYEDSTDIPCHWCQQECRFSPSEEEDDQWRRKEETTHKQNSRHQEGLLGCEVAAGGNRSRKYSIVQADNNDVIFILEGG